MRRSRDAVGSSTALIVLTLVLFGALSAAPEFPWIGTRDGVFLFDGHGRRPTGPVGRS